MALADQADLVVRLSLKDGLSAGLAKATRNLQGFDKATSNTQRSLGKFSSNIQKTAVIGATAFTGAMIASVNAAADFEAQLNTINTIARETPEGLDAIGDSIRKIARDTGTPLEELTQGYYDLLSAGIKAADAQKVLTAANTLAIGGLASTAETVDLLTTAINAYGADASEAAAIADVFAKTVERGKVTAADLAGTFATVAPLAAEMGIEIEELGAGFADLTAGGTAAGEAATQMAAALTALLKKTPDLEKLEEQTGKNYAALAGSKGLNVALEEMRTDAEKAGIELINLVGRKEALLYILQTTGSELGNYNENLAAMGDAAGTAAEQMAERQKGLNFQLARLKALARDAGITIGSALLPKLTPLIERLNTAITENQGAIERFGTDLAGAFEDVAKAVAQVDWQPFIDGLKFTADVGRTAIGIFQSMPDWLQKLIVAGFAVNKFTGGLVTSIAKDLASAIGKDLLGRGSSPANPLWVQMAGGGVGGAGAGGGKGGVIGTAAGLIMKVAIVGIAADVANTLKPVVTEAASAGHNLIFQGPLEDVGNALEDFGHTLNDLPWPFGPRNTPTILPEIFGGNGALGGNAPVTVENRHLSGMDTKLGDAAFRQNVTNERLEAIRAEGAKTAAALPPVRSEMIGVRQAVAAAQAAGSADTSRTITTLTADSASERIAIANAASRTITQFAGDSTAERTAIANASAAQQSAQERTRAAAQQAAFAIRDKDLSVTVNTTTNVRNNVSISDIIRQSTVARTTYRVAS